MHFYSRSPGSDLYVYRSLRGRGLHGRVPGSDLYGRAAVICMEAFGGCRADKERIDYPISHPVTRWVGFAWGREN